MRELNNWCTLPTKMGDFQMYDTGSEKLILITFGDIANLAIPALLRVHSSCKASEIFGALDCDCSDQLKQSMKLIAKEESGIIFYLQQEGRGQGLSNKIKAIRLAEVEGFDTVEAFDHLNFEQDVRDYQPVVELLQKTGILKVRLITNNPQKVAFLKNSGIEVTEIVALNSIVRDQNKDYLQTKVTKLNHTIKL